MQVASAVLERCEAVGSGEACVGGDTMELGEERMGLVAARFYDRIGGPTAPLSFEPAVTLAIAGHPGAEVELMSRPSVKVPQLSSAPPPMPTPPRREPPDPYKD